MPALLDPLIAGLVIRGLPWAAMEDFSVPAGIVKHWLDGSEAGSRARVLSPGNACFAAQEGKPSSSIDFAAVDELLATWLWGGCVACGSGSAMSPWRFGRTCVQISQR